MAAIFKKNYCEGGNTKSARFVIFKKLGKPAVPADLYPNMMDKAQKILAAA